MNNNKIIASAPLIIFGFLILVFMLGLRHTATTLAQSIPLGSSAPKSDLPVLGRKDTRFITGAWLGKPYIVNFFASWCAECKAEHEELMTLAAVQVPIIGITFKDKADKVSSYLDREGDPFAAVAQDDDGRASAAWKVSSVPETYVIDAHGAIRWHYSGVMTDSIVRDELMPIWEAVRRGQ